MYLCGTREGEGDTHTDKQIHTDRDTETQKGRRLTEQHYHDDLHMRFGGIRKPRLGNSDLLTMAANKVCLFSLYVYGLSLYIYI